MDRKPIVTVGQMPFAAGYISQRANLRRVRQLKRKRAIQKFALKLGVRLAAHD